MLPLTNVSCQHIESPLPLCNVWVLEILDLKTSFLPPTDPAGNVFSCVCLCVCVFRLFCFGCNF